MIAEVISPATAKFGRSYFESIMQSDSQNELGFPSAPEQVQRLLDEVYAVGKLSTEAATLLAAQ
jgi:hypothetical protein